MRYLVIVFLFLTQLGFSQRVYHEDGHVVIQDVDVLHSKSLTAIEDNGFIDVEMNDSTLVLNDRTFDWFLDKNGNQAGIDLQSTLDYLNNQFDSVATTSAIEIDPVFVASPAFGITALQIGDFHPPATGNEPVFDGWDKNVADDFDGQYSSLLGAPSIPSSTSDLVNDSDFATNASVSSAQTNAQNYADANDSDTQLSQEEVEDFAGAMFTANSESGITTTYNDATGKIDITVSGGGGGTNQDLSFSSNSISLSDDPTPSAVSFYCTNVIWAEESGGIASGAREYSFGNGAKGNNNFGLPIWEDMEAVGMIMNAEVAGTSAIVLFDVNAVTQLEGITATSNTSVSYFTTPVSLSQGDLINFRTSTLVGTWSDVRIGLIVKQEVIIE